MVKKYTNDWSLVLVTTPVHRYSVPTSLESVGQGCGLRQPTLSSTDDRVVELPLLAGCAAVS